MIQAEPVDLPVGTADRPYALTGYVTLTCAQQATSQRQQHERKVTCNTTKTLRSATER